MVGACARREDCDIAFRQQAGLNEVLCGGAVVVEPAVVVDFVKSLRASRATPRPCTAMLAPDLICVPSRVTKPAVDCRATEPTASMSVRVKRVRSMLVPALLLVLVALVGCELRSPTALKLTLPPALMLLALKLNSPALFRRTSPLAWSGKVSAAILPADASITSLALMAPPVQVKAPADWTRVRPALSMEPPLALTLAAVTTAALPATVVLSAPLPRFCRSAPLAGSRTPAHAKRVS